MKTLYNMKWPYCADSINSLMQKRLSDETMEDFYYSLINLSKDQTEAQIKQFVEKWNDTPEDPKGYSFEMYLDYERIWRIGYEKIVN